MACGVCARSTRRAASLPGEGSTHLRGCGMTAVGTLATCRRILLGSVLRRAGARWVSLIMAGLLTRKRTVRSAYWGHVRIQSSHL